MTFTMASLADIASTVVVAVVDAALAGGVLGLLERSHRRAQGVSRAPFGADLRHGRDDRDDRDVARTLDELRAARSWGDGGRDGEPTDRHERLLARHSASNQLSCRSSGSGAASRPRAR